MNRLLEFMDAYGAACDFIENELGRHNYIANWKKLHDKEKVVEAWLRDTGRQYRLTDVLTHIDGLVTTGKPWVG